MQSGTITLAWDARGELTIKTSLPMSGENRRLVINVLLDAARAFNQTGGERLVQPAVEIRAG